MVDVAAWKVHTYTYVHVYVCYMYVLTCVYVYAHVLLLTIVDLKLAGHFESRSKSVLQFNWNEAFLS